MKKILRIIGIITAVLILIPVLFVGYFYITRGIIHSATRENLGIYMPHFYADDFEINESLTDSIRYYCFELNDSEIENLKSDIENNSAWRRFTGNKDEFSDVFTFFEDKMNDVDLNNCYIAVYMFSNDSFIDVKNIPDRACDYGCAVFDETNGKYYYYEIVW